MPTVDGVAMKAELQAEKSNLEMRWKWKREEMGNGRKLTLATKKMADFYNIFYLLQFKKNLLKSVMVRKLFERSFI